LVFAAQESAIQEATLMPCSGLMKPDTSKGVKLPPLSRCSLQMQRRSFSTEFKHKAACRVLDQERLPASFFSFSPNWCETRVCVLVFILNPGFRCECFYFRAFFRKVTVHQTFGVLAGWALRRGLLFRPRPGSA